MELEIFDVIRYAYRSRLLFRTETEYRDLVGVSFETIRDRRGDESALSGYYDILNRECRRQCGESLYAMVASYLNSSDVCLGRGFDWRERRQLASRKKFCRWMFRKAAMPMRRMTVDEELRFSPKDCDEELLDALLEADADPAFVTLMTFGVVRTFDREAERSRDVSEEETRLSLKAFDNLVRTLWDDIPPAKVIPRPLIFDRVLEQLRQMGEEDCPDFSVAEAWAQVNEIMNACRAGDSPQKGVEGNWSADAFSMPGIWIDDSDRGESRFWIFPENKVAAFCYKRVSGNWMLSPYEFCVIYNKLKGEASDCCIFISPEGGRRIVSKPEGTLRPSDIVTAIYECGEEDEYGGFGEISFEIDSGNNPEWFDWRSFRRLKKDDPLHARFMQTVREIYNPESPHSLLFQNDAPELIDTVDALVGMDGKYLYVSDMPKPRQFRLRLDDEGSECFSYVGVWRKGERTTSLRDMTVSERYPLYIIPRFRDMGERMTERERRFAEAAMNTDMDSTVTIYHTAACPEGLLCFNDFSLYFPLSEIGEYGGIRIEKRE